MVRRYGAVLGAGDFSRLATVPSADTRQNGLALALREVGRIERTLFTLDWLEDPGLRRQATAELNKGEARNALARAALMLTICLLGVYSCPFYGVTPDRIGVTKGGLRPGSQRA